MLKFIASRAAAFICSTVLGISAIALLVTCYVVGSQSPASAVVTPPATPDHVAQLKDAPSGCAFQGTMSCADDVTDLLAKDAFNAYATGSEFSYSETLAGFNSTYSRAITSNGKYDPATEITIPSQNFSHVFYVFRVSK